jgi:pyruvate dehydrogenase E2 component (dihydrolipoamide acetyltransferase)
LSLEAATTQSTAVLMPKIGQAMAEGVILQWHKQDGDHVNQGEIIVTIETDKATYDLEAQASGVLRIYVGEGREVKVGTVIGEIGDGQRAAGVSAAPAAPAVAPSAAAQARPPARGKKVLASPKAKQLAAEHGVDLATVTPASADGIISASDVEQAIAKKAQSPRVAGGQPGEAPASLVGAGRAVRERRKLMGIRKTAARRLQEAWQTIPHIVQMVDVDATGLRDARAALQSEIPSLTLNDLILHAAAQVIAGLPELNGTVEGDELALYDGVDIGFAVDTPRGLIAPVIRHAETLSIAQLAAESQRLIEAARASKLGPEHIGNATLTVSNLGMFGVRFGAPVINLGEPILVFVGAVEDRPVVIGGHIVIRPMLTLSIAYDHRVADGVAASQFTRGLKERLESLASEQRSKSQVPNSAPNPQSPIPNPQEDLGKREIRSVSEGDGYAIQVRSHDHEWTLDEPASDGGTNRGPDPVSALLGALLSCMTISLKAAAKRRKVALQRVTGRVQATPQGHVKNITMTLEVWSGAPEANVRALLEPAKRGCYVSGVLKPEIDFTIELVVHGV